MAHRTKYEEPYEGELDSHGGIIVKEMLKKLSTIGVTVLVSGIVTIFQDRPSVAIIEFFILTPTQKRTPGLDEDIIKFRKRFY